MGTAMLLTNWEKLPGWFLPVWLGATAFTIWWTLPIKKVALEGDRFLISNYRRGVSVPASHLRRISEDAGNRTPNITLYFDPPTAFGRKVRIVPPIEPFDDKQFGNVAELLRAIVEKNDGDRD